MNITMVVQTTDLDGTARALAAELQDWDGDITTRQVNPGEVPDEVRKAVDPVAVASLIISLPAAALTVLDLADRIRKRRRAESLIKRAKELRVANDTVAFVLTSGTSVALDTISADELLDMAATPDGPATP